MSDFNKTKLEIWAECMARQTEYEVKRDKARHWEKVAPIVGILVALLGVLIVVVLDWVGVI